MLRFIQTALLASSLGVAQWALAADWSVVSANFDGYDLHSSYDFRDGEATQGRVVADPGAYGGYRYGGAWVLRNHADPAAASTLYTFSGSTHQVDLTPGSERINVGDLNWRGLSSVINDGSDEFGGWLYEFNFGGNASPEHWEYNRYTTYGSGTFEIFDWELVDGDPWVPLTVNGDGSYTATWLYDHFNDDGAIKDQYCFGNFSRGDFESCTAEANASLSRITLTFQAAPVPEPSRLILLAFGLAGVAAVARRRAKRA